MKLLRKSLFAFILAIPILVCGTASVSASERSLEEIETGAQGYIPEETGILHVNLVVEKEMDREIEVVLVPEADEQANYQFTLSLSREYRVDKEVPVGTYRGMAYFNDPEKTDADRVNISQEMIEISEEKEADVRLIAGSKEYVEKSEWLLDNKDENNEWFYGIISSDDVEEIQDVFFAREGNESAEIAATHEGFVSGGTGDHDTSESISDSGDVENTSSVSVIAEGGDKGEQERSNKTNNIFLVMTIIVVIIWGSVFANRRIKRER